MHWSFNTTQWMGKAIGFTCALVWVPIDALWLPVGLITAIALGHIYDMWSAGQSDPNLAGLTPGTRNREGSATCELQYLFSAAGRISKASGKVTRAHITRTEQIIKSLRLDMAGRTQAIAWFEQGKNPDANFATLAKQCLTGANSKRKVHTAVVQCLCDFAVLEPTTDSVKELKRLAGMLGFASGRVGQLFGEAHSRRTFRREPPPNPRRPGQAQAEPDAPTATETGTPANVAAAYHYLDVAPGANLDTVKRAYRRLISRYHPDRLGNSASASEVSHAQRKMVELRDALETIEAYQRS